MQFKDLLIGPLFLIIIIAIAWMIRPSVTQKEDRKYFFPALLLRLFGALALGLLYDFYYGGGDTLTFHRHGSRIIWSSLFDDLEIWWQLMAHPGEYMAKSFEYARNIWTFNDPASYFVVRTAALFDTITFGSYVGTAFCFAFVAFLSHWMMYRAFSRLFPAIRRYIAYAVLFIPSIVFWGSGILKDTITLAALSWLVYFFIEFFIQGKRSIWLILLAGLSAYTLFYVKIYIFLIAVPCLLLWWTTKNISVIKDPILKALALPFLGVILIVGTFYAMRIVGEQNRKYSLDNIAETVQVQAYDIAYWTGKGAGSTYELGELDGTWQSMIKLAPQAINVALFRPYPWEVRNPLMVLSMIESLGMLLFTLYIFTRAGIREMIINLKRPEVIFCLAFSFAFAFATGISTFNFGTLSRYRIPLLPFYVLGLLIIWYYQEERKFEKQLSFS
ncbi:hypothetical protein OO013_05920 [Mangrovivirga sp. M17]|uniref:Glycosyltransferase RgtA/B/C/D-like domain-containing protein n=1 Tax=Mangrovivirga halotolerans TaxID=2993936 RepID=A0ABT3RNL0_9BACT|nr:hypothetical protein [Mangrovivirga halotolerans]MCX2743393.1 hypothetical protein [Mangrovivirga halotolerans]